MAEGGIPKASPKSKARKLEVEDLLKGRDSMEHIFARDLITFVMSRRIPSWNFGDRFGGQGPITPFSFRIRLAVERYLQNEAMDIYLLFNKMFSGLPFNYHSFVRVASWLVECVDRDVDSMHELLRLLALLTHFTTLAYKRGIHMAPYYTLIVIQDLLCRYMRQKEMDPNVFYVDLGNHAQRLSPETSPVPDLSFSRP